MYTIYKITNEKTSKSYIGYTKLSIQKRWAAHKSNARSVKNPSKFQKELLESNFSGWSIKTLESNVSKLEYREKERQYILLCDTKQNGYSSNDGGGGTETHTEETRKKMSIERLGKPRPNHVIEALKKSNKNRIISTETRIKIGMASLGRPCTKETREKLRITSTGRTLSVEARQKISNKLKGKPKPIWSVQKHKEFMHGKTNRQLKWEILTPDNTLMVVTNLSKFCRENFLNQSNMIAVSKNRRNNHMGYRCTKAISK